MKLQAGVAGAGIPRLRTPARRAGVPQGRSSDTLLCGGAAQVSGEVPGIGARHARGCDRHDIDLITSAYHEDGLDEHGHAVNTGPDYGLWANTTHAETSRVHTHNITTHTCEIDGDTAHAESYAIVVLIGVDGKSAQVISGRYIDRLERRDGQWRIAVRRSTVEGMFIADARVLGSSFFTDKGYLVGTRDRTDLSYERPLSMDTPAPARW